MMLLNIPTIFGVSIEVYFILLVIAMPTFFIWRRLIRKSIKVDKTRQIVIWGATLLGAPIIYIGLMMLWVFSAYYHPTHDFDKERWFENKEKRYELSEDIIESKMLIGKTKSEVRQLLGDENNSDQIDSWSYYLGFKPGIANIDPDVLDIEFKEGKVISVGQHET